MSGYLHSFLIEPVVRQARRFSRPSVNDAAQPSPEHGPEISGQGRSPLLDVERSRDRRRLTLHNGNPSTHLSSQSSTQVAPAGLEQPEGEATLRAWTDDHRRINISEQRRASQAENGVSGSRPSPQPSFSQTSNNPEYRSPRSLRSATSSISSSIQLILDSTTIGAQDSSTANQQDGRGRDPSLPPTGDQVLPEDDGMGSMRQRIFAIQRTDSSSMEKAKLVHQLMTEHYSTSQASLHAPQPSQARSPASLASNGRPITPSSLHSVDQSALCTSSPTSTSSFADASNPFNVFPEDLKPTFYQKLLANESVAESETCLSDRRLGHSEEEVKSLGCPHYRRNIKLQCSTCYRWYTCRFCHDEVQDHALNRRETKNMLCMFCGCAQVASEACVQCGERSARYYCSVCKLWDDHPGKRIYHCNDCGICRIGEGLGKDFFHCKICCACIAISIRDTHRCIERSTDCDCPICGEYMFTSPLTVVFMKCGHSIHHKCYYEYMKRSYRCPICSMSIVNMEMQFRHLERAIESQPMPPEFQDTKAWIYCNDCNAKSSVKYHWLGLKCGVCDSYNTAQLQMERAPNSVRNVAEQAPSSPDSLHSRGRGSEIAAQYQRITSSAPPSTVWPPEYDISRRTAHSQGPQAANHRLSAGGSDLSSDSQDSADGGSDEEYSEVDFWGLENPSSRDRIALPNGALDGDSEDIDDSQGDTDDEMSDGDLDDLVDDEDDQMEIFGHR
ncbi:MAG: hypothetical protein Q9222_001483 [Ikaeria aurantiellina]